MPAQRKRTKAKKNSQEKKPVSGRTLLNPEEWEDPTGRRVISEYHKEALSDNQTGALPEEKDRQAEKPMDASEKSDSFRHKTKVTQFFDIANIEMLAYALSRSLFRRGVQVPLKVKNVVDMDIAVKDTDIILNTNDVSFQLPPLQIWHVIFSYKGKPVIEYGRGVNNDLKIHYSRAISMLLAMWVGRRRQRRARQQAAEDACKEVAESSKTKYEQNAT